MCEIGIEKLTPGLYSSLLYLLQKEDKDMIEKSINVFLNTNNTLLNSRYWGPMSLLLFLGGIESLKIKNNDFERIFYYQY